MMVIKKYGQTSSLGRRSVSDKRIDRRAKRQEEEEKNAGFVEQTAVYDKSAGGVITSEGDFYETKDTSWRPEGFVNLGSRSALMVKKSQGGKQIGSRDNRGIPDAKVYSAYSDKYMEGKDTGNFDIVKNAMGKVIEIRAKPKEYMTEYRQGQNANPIDHSNRYKVYGTYSPTVAKFDPMTGNILSEVTTVPYRKKYTDNSSLYKTWHGIMPDITKLYKNNKLSEEIDRDSYLAEGRSSKNYDRSSYSTYEKSRKNFDTMMQTGNNKPGYTGRETRGGVTTRYIKGRVESKTYPDGTRVFADGGRSRSSVVNPKLMINDMANKMAYVGNTKTSNRLKNFLRGGQSNLTFGSSGKSNSLTFGSSTPVVKNEKTTQMTNLGMQSIAPSFMKATTIIKKTPVGEKGFFNNAKKLDIRSKI